MISLAFYLLSSIITASHACDNSLFIGTNSSISLWNPSSGEKLNTYNNFTSESFLSNPINTVRFSPDGLTFALISEDNRIQILDIINLEGSKPLNVTPRKTIQEPLANGLTTELLFSKDGYKLYTNSGDRETVIQVYDPNTGEVIQKLLYKRGEKKANNLIFNNGGRTLVHAWGNKILIWDIENSLLSKSIDIDASGDFEGKIIFSKVVRDLFAVCKKDSELSFWNSTTGELINSIADSLKNNYKCSGMVFHSNSTGEYLIVPLIWFPNSINWMILNQTHHHVDINFRLTI